MDPVPFLPDLSVEVETGRATHKVIDGGALVLFPGRALDLLGDSGCIRSLATMGRLLDRLRIAVCSIRLMGEELVGIDPVPCRGRGGAPAVQGQGRPPLPMGLPGAASRDQRCASWRRAPLRLPFRQRPAPCRTLPPDVCPGSTGRGQPISLPPRRASSAIAAR